MPRASLFSTLGTDEIERVILWTSRYPYSKSWLEGVDDATIDVLMDPICDFKAITCRILEQSELQDDTPFTFRLKDPFRIRRFNPRTFRTSTLTNIAPYLKRTRISFRNFARLEEPRFQACLNQVSHLHFVAKLFYDGFEQDTRDDRSREMILTRIGPKLKTLEVEYWRDISSWPHIVRFHCPVLREFNIIMASFDVVADEAFWCDVGPRLNSLTINYLRGYGNTVDDAIRTELEVIKTHCTAIDSLHISAGRVNSDVLARVLASYENQLQYATIDDFDEQQAQIVATACSNVQVKLIIRNPDACGVLSIFDTAAREIEVMGAPWHSFPSNIPLDQSAKTVRSLQITYVSFDLLFALLSKDMPNLEILFIGVDHHRPGTMLKLLSENTGRLTSIQLHTRTPKPEHLRTFVHANPNLQVLKFFLHNTPRVRSHEWRHVDVSAPYTPFFYYADLIRALAKHPYLREISLRSAWHPQQASGRRFFTIACVPLRHRPVHVSIEGRQYLPY